jgi:hypothetical protein
MYSDHGGSINRRHRGEEGSTVIRIELGTMEIIEVVGEVKEEINSVNGI